MAAFVRVVNVRGAVARLSMAVGRAPGLSGLRGALARTASVWASLPLVSRVRGKTGGITNIKGDA